MLKFASGLIAALVLTSATCADAQAPRPWLVPDLLAAAKSEGGTLTMYASMNEEEALPYWAIFEQATGIKVNFVRMSDSNIRARVAIEHRAGQHTWDIVATSPVYRLGNEILTPFDPPQAKDLIPQARDANRRWYGYSGNYNTPAYNTAKVKPEELPKSYEEFIDRKQWAGKVAIDATDTEWLAHYGEERASKLLRDIVVALKPVVIDGHLNLARQVGAGEYLVALNNYVPLTINLKLAGVPTDFWALDPVSLTFGSIGIYAQAPHPKTALLAANFVMSQQAQTFLTKFGRLPTRLDVETNPPGVLELLGSKTIVTTMTSVNEQRRMQQAFNDIFRPR